MINFDIEKLRVFLNLLVEYDCPHALHLILDRAAEANMAPEAWLKQVIESPRAEEAELSTRIVAMLEKDLVRKNPLHFNGDKAQRPT